MGWAGSGYEPIICCAYLFIEGEAGSAAQSPVARARGGREHLIICKGYKEIKVRHHLANILYPKYFM